MYSYCISENFRGWKRSLILRFESHLWKFSPSNFGRAIPTHDWFSIPRKFSPQNVHFLSIRESFLYWKFPAIWYRCMADSLLLPLTCHLENMSEDVIWNLFAIFNHLNPLLDAVSANHWELSSLLCSLLLQVDVSAELTCERNNNT